jgi:hypothetical protein
MPSTQVVDVVVGELTKYGYKDQQGYVSYSKKLSDGDKAKVVPGVKFQAEYYVAESGTRYLNKVFATLQKADPVKKETPVKAKTETKAPIPAGTLTDTPMTRMDWDAKDRRISRQGVIQAAVQAVSHLSADEHALFEMAKCLANEMLDFVNEK